MTVVAEVICAVVIDEGGPSGGAMQAMRAKGLASLHRVLPLLTLFESPPQEN